MIRRKFLTGLLATIATGLAAAPDDSWADHQRNRGGRPRGRPRRRNRGRTRSIFPQRPEARSSGPERARRALREGSVLPLGDIMGIISRRFPGKVLDADLVREGRRYVYYLKVLDPQGRLAEVAVDGESGRVLGARGRRR